MPHCYWPQADVSTRLFTHHHGTGGIAQEFFNGLLHQTTIDLAIRLNHHLFDTLYHAVALHTSRAVLITADRRYFTKAEPIGHIVLPDDPGLTDDQHPDA
mgnify:CR=1 FL=1